MDDPCSFEQLRACLEDIARVNRLTFAYRPTLHWLDYVYSVMPLQEKPLHIVDVGCGYGDALRRIYHWAQERRLPVTLTGIDRNRDAVRAARAVTPPNTVIYLHGNAFDYAPPQGIDVVLSSLVTHHMENAEIVTFLRWMEQKARIGWFINDLSRAALPYRLLRLLAPFSGLHPFVKHDAPVSILRAFRPADWQRLLTAAEIPASNYLIRSYRPARLCVARMK